MQIEQGCRTKTDRTRRIGERLSNAYRDSTLFASSYVPLLIIFGVRMWSNYPDYAFWACAAAAVLTLDLFGLLNARTAPRDFYVKSATRGGSEVAIYVATYVLPLLVVGDAGLWNFAAYGALMILLGIVMTQDEKLYVNPLLAIFGLRLSTIVTEDDERYFLFSARLISAGSTVRAVPVKSRLLYER